MTKTRGPDVLVSDVDAGPTYKVLQMHVRTAWTAATESYAEFNFTC
jgi:hypothetical protein